MFREIHATTVTRVRIKIVIMLGNLFFFIVNCFPKRELLPKLIRI